jgi:ABC-type uncharacterized transport system substrate-binding protein
MLKRITTGIFFLFIPLLNAAAHPHVFVKTSEEFVWKGEKLSGVWETWQFDRFFSSDIISWLDTDKDGDFNEVESKQVHDKAFINLKNYYFYTFIRQGTKRTNPAGVQNFRAHVQDGVMIYRFFIDLSHYTGHDLYFAVYDYTYYTDVEYLEPVKLTYDSSTVHPAYSIKENKQYPVYYDPCGPATDTSVHYKWAPGLQIYYPREIHITW